MRLEGSMQRMDSRPFFETRARARSSGRGPACGPSHRHRVKPAFAALHNTQHTGSCGELMGFAKGSTHPTGCNSRQFIRACSRLFRGRRTQDEPVSPRNSLDVQYLPPGIRGSQYSHSCNCGFVALLRFGGRTIDLEYEMVIIQPNRGYHGKRQFDITGQFKRIDDHSPNA
jgi:hypothetical protein